MLRTILVLLIGGTLLAQPQPDSQSGLIVGQVVDAASGRPVSGAVVRLSGPPTSFGPHPRILTGADGRFFFRALRRGNYVVGATKGGYVDGTYGQLRPLGSSLPIALADGQRFGGATVRLWRHAAISGTVVDESGEPQVRVVVRAYRRGVQAGRVRFLPSGLAGTDDRGMFRISGLVPGAYLVGTENTYHSAMIAAVKDRTAQVRDAGPGTAASNAVGLVSRSGFVASGEAGFFVPPGTLLPPVGRSGQMVYPPTFHPAATSGQAASVIPVVSGQEYLGADLQITPVTTVAVSGAVIGPDGPVSGAQIHLKSGSAEDLISTNWLVAGSDRAGRFSFPAVPPGHYRLKLLLAGGGAAPQRADPRSAPIVWVDQPLSVGIDPIADIHVTAMAGLNIRGRLEFDGSLARSRNAPNNLQILFERADSDPDFEPSTYNGRADVAGDFSSHPLPAGEYYVRVPNSPPGWMFLGATLEGRDVTDTPVYVTSDVHNVAIRFTDRWSGIQGSVQNAKGRDGTALVVAFPTDSELWSGGGANSRRNRSTRTASTGEYSFNLPPGDYYVLAVPEESAADWRDPDFLHAAARVATVVRVGLGERKIQDLRTRRIQ